MKPIWSGGISFGLIYIPVKLYNASRSATLDFDLLNRANKHRIGYAKIDKVTGKEIDQADIVRGFQVEKDEYVVIEDDEFEKANVKRSKSIDIKGFAEIKEIDPKYFEKPYFLEPEEGAEKTYALLVEALKQTAKAGVARFVLRDREHLALVAVEQEHLILIQMRFADEVIIPDQLNFPSIRQLDKEELSTAVEIVERMSKKFQPDKFTDTYREELLELIKEKATHKKITARSEAPKPTDVKDLMAKLKQSLQLAKAAK